MYIRVSLVCLGLALLLAGCSSLLPAGGPSATPPGPKEIPADSTPYPSMPSPPIQVTEVNPSLPIPSLPNLNDLVDIAIQDLSGKLSISTTEIKLLESRQVTWPDASLGCPKIGVLYIQQLTPGYLIRLEAVGQEYEYHSGLHGPVFFCEKPSASAPGS